MIDLFDTYILIYRIKNPRAGAWSGHRCRHEDATLVTHNTREFARVSGLRVEDWVDMSSGA